MGLSVETNFSLVILVTLETRNVNTLTFLNKKKFQEKLTKTKNVCILMMTSGIHGWQLAFSRKYRSSSKMLTETTLKAFSTTQKPRIYSFIENKF